MSQLNIQMTPEFENNLRRYMASRGIKNKSEAVRRAIEEGLGRTPDPSKFSWTSLRGQGLGTTTPQFTGNDQLW
jgi:hypothetical protein